jgi:hypothetical protein
VRSSFYHIAFQQKRILENISFPFCCWHYHWTVSFDSDNDNVSQRQGQIKVYTYCRWRTVLYVDATYLILKLENPLFSWRKRLNPWRTTYQKISKAYEVEKRDKHDSALSSTLLSPFQNLISWPIWSHTREFLTQSKNSRDTISLSGPVKKQNPFFSWSE